MGIATHPTSALRLQISLRSRAVASAPASAAPSIESATARDPFALGTGITNTTSANASTKTRPDRAAPADRRAIPDQAQRACRSSRCDPHNSRSWTTIARFRGRGMTRLRSRDSGETSHWEPTASRRRTGGHGCCGSMCAAKDAPPASRASAGADRAERRLRVLDRRIDTTQREAGGGGAQRAWTVLTQRAGAQRHSALPATGSQGAPGPARRRTASPRSRHRSRPAAPDSARNASAMRAGGSSERLCGVACTPTRVTGAEPPHRVKREPLGDALLNRPLRLTASSVPAAAPRRAQAARPSVRAGGRSVLR